MTRSLEVVDTDLTNTKENLKAYVEECRDQHKDIKEQILGLHVLHKETNDTLKQLVKHDKEINMISAYVKSLQDLTEDYKEVRAKSYNADSSIKWVIKIIVGAAIAAVLSLIFVTKG